MLDADWSFLIVMIPITLVMSVVAYFTTRRLGKDIERVNRYEGEQRLIPINSKFLPEFMTWTPKVLCLTFGVTSYSNKDCSSERYFWISPLKVPVFYRTIRKFLTSYHAKLKRISRGMPAPFTFAMSASNAGVIFACSEEYFFANS